MKEFEFKMVKATYGNGYESVRAETESKAISVMNRCNAEWLEVREVKPYPFTLCAGVKMEKKNYNRGLARNPMSLPRYQSKKMNK